MRCMKLILETGDMSVTAVVEDQSRCTCCTTGMDLFSSAQGCDERSK